ncbi:MAG: heat shock protein HtpX [Acidimicrobiaceae bacterium]|jgi:heat shock protein HtpX|nr:heat shock protein HtpX [Acidimicrobiaceae bacterium]
MSKNTIKTVILLAFIGGLFMLVGQLIGGRNGLTIAFFIAIAFVGFQYWMSDTIAIKAARAVPVSEAQMPEYYAIVRDLTQRAGLPMPKLFVTPDMQPNAFATGRSPNHAAVAVTRGILEICSWDEMKGVLAHELCHVGNRDILITSIAASLALAITFVSRFALFFGGGGDRDGNLFEQLALIILAPLAATILQLALSRSREYEADRCGARMLGDGEPLARALAKLEAGARQVPMNIPPAVAPLFIVNPLTGRKIAFKKLFADHPPTEDRIRRLRSREWAN